MNIYLKQKVFAIGDKYDFTDYNQKLLYQGKKPALSITKMYLYDAEGKEIYYIKKKLFSFLSKYTVYKDGKKVLQVNKKFSFSPKYVITDSNNNEYSLQGNIIAYDFELKCNDRFVGSVRKEYFSFGDAYELTISDDYDPALFCSIALIIDNCNHNKVHKR